MNYAMSVIVYSCGDLCVCVARCLCPIHLYVKYVFIDDLSLEAFASRICLFLSTTKPRARTHTYVSPKAQKVFVPMGTKQFLMLIIVYTDRILFNQFRWILQFKFILKEIGSLCSLYNIHAECKHTRIGYWNAWSDGGDRNVFAIAHSWWTWMITLPCTHIVQDQKRWHFFCSASFCFVSSMVVTGSKQKKSCVYSFVEGGTSFFDSFFTSWRQAFCSEKLLYLHAQ